MVGRHAGFGDWRARIPGMRGAMGDEVTEEAPGRQAAQDEAADGPAVPQEGDAGQHWGEGHGPPDKSARQTEGQPAPTRAELSNYEIVEHWFRVAAERLELTDDVAAVFRSSYLPDRERYSRHVPAALAIRDGVAE